MVLNDNLGKVAMLFTLTPCDSKHMAEADQSTHLFIK
jgi:hypothetical protein